jgi:hypothetical protein
MTVTVPYTAHMSPKTGFIYHIKKSMPIAVGLVLVWRGIWYAIEEVDRLFFSDFHGYTAAIGFVLGILILYLPDKDLKEIERL